MATRSSKNNVLAGAFVLVSIILGVVIVIVLSDLRERLLPKRDYVVHFPLAGGAEGLASGSPVKVGGQPVGRVTGWTFALREGTGVPTGVNVTIRVRADVIVYEDATVLLVQPLLGSTSAINIPDLGTPAAGQAQQMAILRGGIAAPSFLAQAGYGPEQQRQVQSIISNVERASQTIDRLTARVDSEIDPAIQTVRAILADAQVVSGDVREAWPVWRSRIDSTLASINTAAESFQPVMATAQETVDEALLLIRDNRTRVEATLRNVQELSEKANTEGWEMARTILERGQHGVDDFAATAARIELLVREEAPQLQTIVANARLASDQLKLTTAEVRAAPWKLLARPTGRRELENEALFDSARQYSIAVSNLRATAASLESVAQASHARDTRPMERAQIDALLRDLENAFARYQQAEEAFLDRLITPTGR